MEKIYDINYRLNTNCNFTVKSDNIANARKIALEELDNMSKEDLVERFLAALDYNLTFKIISVEELEGEENEDCEEDSNSENIEEQDRIKRIEMYAQSEQKKQKALEEAKQLLTEQLISKIKAYQPRIQKLIDTANACIANGICISAPDLWGGSKNPLDFTNSGVHHNLGFVYNECRKNNITLLGIDAGGYCGDWDFRTNGLETYSEHEDTKQRKLPIIKDMEKFINLFDSFEESFYAYVDSKINK